MEDRSFEAIVQRVFELKGLDVLLSSKTFVACISDVAEQKFQREVRILSRNIDDSMLAVLYDGALDGDKSLRVAEGKISCVLREECFISEDVALAISSDLANATGSFLKSRSTVGSQQNSRVDTPWGPERPVYSWAEKAPHATINSIIDNPGVGDERNFVRIREVVDGQHFRDEVELKPDKTYEVYIYYHNNADPQTIGKKAIGIADGLAVKSSFPSAVKPGRRYAATATLFASDTDPLAVWDGAYMHSTQELRLHYVPGSATIHNGGDLDGLPIGPDYLFGEGALLGFNIFSGLLPGGNEYAGYITYRFAATSIEKPSADSIEETRVISSALVLDPADDIEEAHLNEILNKSRSDLMRELAVAISRIAEKKAFEDNNIEVLVLSKTGEERTAERFSVRRLGKWFEGLDCWDIGFVGDCCFYGYWVDKDVELAAELYALGAEDGDVESCYALGFLFFEGSAVTDKDYARAAGWFQKATEKGHGPAAYALGYCYRYGLGVSANPQEAENCFTIADSKRVAAARKALKSPYGASYPERIVDKERFDGSFSAHMARRVFLGAPEGFVVKDKERLRRAL